jgi:flagella basal body P-ring formation protein FlgA
VKVLRQTSVVLAVAAWCILVCAIANAETLQIPVPIRNISPGEQINGNEFLQKSFEVSSIAKTNYVTQQAQLADMEAFRILRGGKPVPLASLKRKAAVRKGQITVARFASFGVEIAGQLMPLKDGHEGEIIPCKNLTSGLTIEAIAMVDGSLSVGLQ